MRSIVRIVFVVITLLVTFSAANAMDFEKVVQEINPDKTTSAYRKVFWRDIKGSPVTWSGKLYDMRGGFHDVYKVFVLVGHPTLGKYNVIMTVHAQPEIAKLKKDSIIKFTGTLDKYKWSKPKPVKLPDGSINYVRKYVIYLDNARIDFGANK